MQSMFFLETIALKDDYEKDQFFKRLAPLIEALPPDVSRYKVGDCALVFFFAQCVLLQDPA